MKTKNFFKKFITVMYKAIVAQFIVFGSLFGNPPNLKDEPFNKEVARGKDE